MKKAYLASLMPLVIFALGLISFTHLCAATLIQDPVKTESGYVSGTTIGEGNNEVKIYKGIPYAAPPVGDLRWKAPQPAAPWQGVLAATEYSKWPIQFGGTFGITEEGQSEDCLYLNVITPAKNKNAKLPVMVWFHGGGYMVGSGNDPLFNSYRLPRQGVILVTVNTRLGPLGLLAHPYLSDESPNLASGNWMFLDMVASLKWVKNNIAAFGGNPKNVTIFGESGGAGKVISLMASPMTTGLIHKAIGESGFATAMTLGEMEVRGIQFFEELGVTTLADARTKTWQEIVAAETAMEAKYPVPPGVIHMGVIFDATVDHAFLNDTPANTFTAGKQQKIPFIMGGNLGELTSPGIIAMPYIIPYYTNMFKGALKQKQKVFGYVFDQVPQNWRDMGAVATHAIELNYVFGNYDNFAPTSWTLIGALESLYNPAIMTTPVILTETDQKVSEEAMAMWAQFAKKGNPSVKGLTTWPAWTAASDQYMYIADPLQVKTGFSTVGQ